MRTWIIGVGFVLCFACGGSPAPAAETAAEVEEAPPLPTEPLGPEEAAQAQTQALRSFLRAREHDARCTETREESECQRARHLFRVAADTWNALLVGRRDDDTAAADWTFMHAQALLRAGRPVQAADSAERYIAHGDNPEWRVRAAEILVTCRERAITDANVEVRTAPPEPSDGNVEPIALPDEVRLLREARARYIETVPEASDAEHKRRGFALENALVLHRYGHFDEARTELRPIFEAGCTGEGAWDGAASAWRTMREIAILLGRYDAVAELGREIATRSCDFGAPEPQCDGLGDDPRCLARTDAVSVQLRTGTTLLQRAQYARPNERARWANRAGEAFLSAIRESNLAPLARLAALTQAATAFRAAQNAEQATAVDRRIASEVDPSTFEEAERPQVVEVVAAALLRILALARRSNAHEDVVLVAARLLTDDFDLPELADERETARSIVPASLTALNRHREASEAWTALAESTADARVRREAELAAALAWVTAADCRRAGTALSAYARAHRGEDGAGDSVIRALYEYAMCQREGAARQRALDEVAEAAGEARDALSAESKGRAAAATLAIVDRDFAALDRLRIRIPRGENTEALVTDLREELAEPAAEVRELVAGYDRVVAFGDARASAHAHYRAGLALEKLAAVVLAATWTVPQDLERQRRDLTREAYDQLRGIVEARAAEVLEAQARPIRCLAAQRFEASIGVAQRGSVESEHATEARARLDAIGSAVVQRCRTNRPAAL